MSHSHQDGYVVWMAAIASSACIGFTSLVPWLFNMTFFEQHKREKVASSSTNRDSMSTDSNQLDETTKGSNNKIEPILPTIGLPIANESSSLQLYGEYEDKDGRMKFLLSFAVGSILGDIFFHLIPESLQSHIIELDDSRAEAQQKVGLSIIAGIFMFIIVEMILEKWAHSTKTGSSQTSIQKHLEEKQKDYYVIQDTLKPLLSKKNDLKQADMKSEFVNYDNSQEALRNNNSLMTDFNANKSKQDFEWDVDLVNSNNSDSTVGQHLKFRRKDVFNELGAQDGVVAHKTLIKKPEDNENQISGCKIIDVAGYLSLIANGFDNFTHGLAIGASFLVGPKVGLLTTFVIFIHEIPHEICDYAILVNSGFSRWEAVKAQSSVSLFGIVGTATALYVKSVQALNAKTVWILPFSAGGFLYIALVNLLPEILDRKANSSNSFGQVACVILGIVFMGLVALL